MPKYSSRVEDYLKTILLIFQEKGYVRTKDLAARLRVKPPSVTEMLHKLAERKLILYKQYEGVKLTTKGLRAARLVRKRQEVLENLFRLMSVSEKTTHLDSCKLEHQLSCETLEALQSFLRFLEDKGLYEKLQNDFKKIRSA